MKLQRKSWILLVVFVMVFTLVLAGCGGKSNPTAEQPPAENNNSGAGEKPAEEPKKTITVGMVTDVGGVNDNSFNQSAWEGLQTFEAATGSKVDYLQSQGDADYVPNLNQFVKNGTDLTWGIGFMMSDAIKQVADQNPDSKLAIIDGEVEAPNVASITFKEQEGSFLVGVVAALMTKSNKIGFVGGAEIPVIKRFELGFVAGVNAANPDAKVIVNYTGAFDAPDQGKAAAATIYNDGADIIFHAAGSTGDGVFNEGIERKKKNSDIWVIGVDKDQALTFGHEITLTSMVKRVDKAVIQISTDLANGNFKSGKQNLGLSDNAVGLPDNNPNVPDDVLQKVKEFADKIVKGEIEVPTA